MLVKNRQPKQKRHSIDQNLNNPRGKQTTKVVLSINTNNVDINHIALSKRFCKLVITF